MINISFEQFIQEGRWGPLEVGYSREKIILLIGEPEWSDKEDIYTSDLWTYGNIEFYFNYQEPGPDKLGMIFTDNLNTLDGGNVFNIIPWIFNQEKDFKLSLDETKEIIMKNNINFKIVKGYSEDQYQMVLKSGVTIAFEKDDESDEVSYNASGLWLHYSDKIKKLE